MRDLETIKQEIKDTQKVEEIKKMFDKEGIEIESLLYNRYIDVDAKTILRDLKIRKDNLERTKKINDIINRIDFD